MQGPICLFLVQITASDTEEYIKKLLGRKRIEEALR